MPDASVTTAALAAPARTPSTEHLSEPPAKRVATETLVEGDGEDPDEEVAEEDDEERAESSDGGSSSDGGDVDAAEVAAELAADADLVDPRNIIAKRPRRAAALASLQQIELHKAAGINLRKSELAARLAEANARLRRQTQEVVDMAKTFGDATDLEQQAAVAALVRQAAVGGSHTVAHGSSRLISEFTDRLELLAMTLEEIAAQEGPLAQERILRTKLIAALRRSTQHGAVPTLPMLVVGSDAGVQCSLTLVRIPPQQAAAFRLRYVVGIKGARETRTCAGYLATDALPRAQDLGYCLRFIDRLTDVCTTAVADVRGTSEQDMAERAKRVEPLLKAAFIALSNGRATLVSAIEDIRGDLEPNVADSPTVDPVPDAAVPAS
ncbi:MAG: hypothetical protein M0R22_11910 [Dehalococcoidia bacterium]|nr:hypothetical protein [Dehalococcoidia bacterium]